MELSGKILKNMEKRIKISNQEIGYQTSYRDVKYPRLEFKNSSGEDYTGSVLQEMTGQDLLSEAEDILIIEDLKRMFFSKSEN